MLFTSVGRFLSANHEREHTSETCNSVIQIVNISIYLDDKSILLNLGVQENLNNSKKRWFQDWESWVKNNLVDFVVVDSKSNNFNQFIFNNKIYEDAFLKENLEKFQQ